uniref:Uncharacterized protein n=1 Tax=Knipowitschia caucasica TaxID=637954 RepID=A0AAV2K2N7_KNICA
MVLDDGLKMSTSLSDINAAANGDAQQAAEFPEQTIEVVSVTEEDLPTVETPNILIVSPLDSFVTEPNGHPERELPEESPPTAPSPSMPITKVQPFLNEDDLRKTVWERVWENRLELILCVIIVVVVIVALGIGLGGQSVVSLWSVCGQSLVSLWSVCVGLSCSGKFKCGASSKCIQASLQCDGKEQCENGEDELSCVRLSGRSSVVQVQKAGLWMTVCYDDWTSWMGESACRQLGYNSYVASSSSGVNSIEPELQYNLVSLDGLSGGVFKLHNMSVTFKSQCTSGKVATLKCLDCGQRPQFRSSPSSRIVGGNSSKAGQFPWQVSLQNKGEHLCGGSIITSQWVLTAAHCVYGFAIPAEWGVYVGITELPGFGSQALEVERIVYHARYRGRLDYDIALIKLRNPLPFNGLVQPICLPNHGELYEAGTLCWISGWGATENGGESSVMLRSAMVPLISTKDCTQKDVYPGMITAGMVCAGYLEGGVDSCQGDSGGPLACEDSSLWKLVGATSWGVGCADQNRPGVYTRITESLSWVRQEMAVSAL